MYVEICFGLVGRKADVVAAVVELICGDEIKVAVWVVEHVFDDNLMRSIVSSNDREKLVSLKGHHTSPAQTLHEVRRGRAFVLNKTRIRYD